MRKSRATKNQYDAIRELVQVTDPQARITKYTWCTCGGLSTLTDANNNVTTWNLDLQGRVTAKIYADTTKTLYLYEQMTSRLHGMSDARYASLTSLYVPIIQTATYAYNADNTLASTTYAALTGVAAATPNVSFTYDPVYNRVTSMTDGTGTTSYTYNPITGSVTTGAGRLASVSVPIYGTGSLATVAYSYDQLGRVVGRSVDGATTNANNVSTTFDALGCVTNVSNALGSFGYSYIDQTGRLSEVTYPNGQKTDYSYFGNTGDQRLKEINNYIAGMISNTPLSDFQYTYNPVGTIATWQQQTDNNTPTVYTLGYDNADQLTSAVQTNTSTSATVSSNAYGYDPAGNRLSETTLSGVTGGQFNNLNQLTALGTTSSQTVAGNTSAPVNSLNVNTVPATVTNGTNFTASVPLPAGTNTLSVVAQPVTGSTTTQQFQTVTTGTAPTPLSYDYNGNTLTDEKGNTYQWDALNRLASITYPGGAISLFAYDGLSRRIQIVEEDASSQHNVTSTKNFLWIGSEIAEERDSSNNVTKRFFPQGEQQSGTPYYYTRDHLGSVRELLNSSGSIVSRISYDMYGNATVVSGTIMPTKGYAGMHWHQPSGFYLTWGRIYDALIGRWLSKDRIGERGGVNLYEYCLDDPDNYFDPYGADPKVPSGTATSNAMDGTVPTPAGPEGDAIPGKVRSGVVTATTEATKAAKRASFWEWVKEITEKLKEPGRRGGVDNVDAYGKGALGICYGMTCVEAQAKYQECINKWLMDPSSPSPCDKIEALKIKICNATAAAAEALVQ